MSQLFTGAPIWVWPLLIGLIVVGARAMRDREAPLWLIYALPLMGVLSLNAVRGLPVGAYIWVIFGGAWCIGVVLGMWAQPRWIIHKGAAKAGLKGEVLTLIQMMVIFWMNFAGGVMRAVAPVMYQAPAFAIGFAICAGVMSGLFAGRALALWRREVG